MIALRIINPDLQKQYSEKANKIFQLKYNNQIDEKTEKEYE